MFNKLEPTIATNSEEEMPYNKISPSWTPVTTHQLNHGPFYYNVMDHFVPEEYDGLREEIQPLLAQLQPAKTKGEVQMTDMLKVLQENSAINPNPNIIDSARGDRSMFLSQELRSSQRFLTEYPMLSNAIHTITNTIFWEMKKSKSAFKLTNRTSVQLALYPGDGKSHYPKHCDVSGGCKSEHHYEGGDDVHRVITATYYLTPKVWTEKDDAGQLRLFDSDNKYVDILPLANRCVVFRSDKVSHQVIASKKRPRVAITCWFYGKIEKLSPMKIESKETANGHSPATKSKQCQPKPLTIHHEPDSTATIFVSIAAYRDSETGPTIRSLLDTADFPHRINIGLIMQVDPKEDKEVFKEFPSRLPNLRTLSMHAKDARGPCYARRLAQLLWKGEDYVLQIDSHMRFRPGWDTYLVEHLPPGKSMLTTYPAGYTLPNNVPDEIRPTLLVPWKFDEEGRLRQKGRLLKQTYPAPIPCHLYAAGFNFARSSVIQDCPYPLYSMFFGEELYMATHLYSQGYQLYTPGESVCYHLWSRGHRKTHETKVKQQDTADLQRHLGLVPFEFWEALRVDWDGRQVLWSADRGGLTKDDFANDDVSQQLGDLDKSAQNLIMQFLTDVQDTATSGLAAKLALGEDLSG